MKILNKISVLTSRGFGLNTYSLDDIDLTLLTELQQNNKLTNAELAEKVKLSPPAVHARIKRLEEAGVITRYVAIVNRELLGYDMLCFIQVSLQSHDPETTHNFRSAITAMPEVLECHQLIGDIDYLLKVVVRSKSDLQRFLMDKIAPIRGVTRFTTSLSLDEIKMTTALPMPKEE
jgi:DNA-binding Lrp family transcriptional regulator